MVIFKNNYYFQGHYLFSKIIIGKKGLLNLGSSLKKMLSFHSLTRLRLVRVKVY
jgi:hypothetical protein